MKELKKPRDELGRFKSGEGHWNWSGGVYVNKRGYRKVLVGKGKYKYEHIVIMEDSLGRKLREDECVHHINEDTLNNDIENLRLMSKSAHSRLHNTGRRWTDVAKKRASDIKQGTSQKEAHAQWNRSVTKESIIDALGKTTKQKCAARTLGINVDTLRARMKYYGIYEGWRRYVGK